MKPTKKSGRDREATWDKIVAALRKIDTNGGTIRSTNRNSWWGRYVTYYVTAKEATSNVTFQFGSIILLNIIKTFVPWEITLVHTVHLAKTDMLLMYNYIIICLALQLVAEMSSVQWCQVCFRILAGALENWPRNLTTFGNLYSDLRTCAKCHVIANRPSICSAPSLVPRSHPSLLQVWSGDETILHHCLQPYCNGVWWLHAVLQKQSLLVQFGSSIYYMY